MGFLEFEHKKYISKRFKLLVLHGSKMQQILTLMPHSAISLANETEMCFKVRTF
jgi:hypothetical protein